MSPIWFFGSPMSAPDTSPERSSQLIAQTLEIKPRLGPETALTARPSIHPYHVLSKRDIALRGAKEYALGHHEKPTFEGIVEDQSRLLSVSTNRIRRAYFMRHFCSRKLRSGGGSERSGAAANSKLHSCWVGHADALAERLQGDCRSEIGSRFGTLPSRGFRCAGGRAGDAKTVRRAGQALAASDSQAWRGRHEQSGAAGFVVSEQQVRGSGWKIQRDVWMGQLLHRSWPGGRQKDRAGARDGREFFL